MKVKKECMRRGLWARLVLSSAGAIQHQGRLDYNRDPAVVQLYVRNDNPQGACAARGLILKLKELTKWLTS